MRSSPNAPRRWTPVRRARLQKKLNKLELPTPTEIRAEKARRHLADFMRLGWHVVEPATPLLWSWHLDAIAEHLEAQLAGEIRRLVINVPPGCMKSLSVNVFGSAWAWLSNPALRMIFASANPRVALRDSTKTRDLIESEWFQTTFRPQWLLREDQNAKSLFKNTKTGTRLAVGIGAKIIGERADAVFVDDPHEPTEVHSEAHRRAVVDWHDLALSRRLDPRHGTETVIMQRLHEGDLTGHLLERGGVTHLCLPMEFVSKRRCVTSLGVKGEWEDPREAEGELLFPALFPEAAVALMKTDLGEMGYAGQGQQDPSPADGAIFKTKWWRRYQLVGTPDVDPRDGRCELAWADNRRIELRNLDQLVLSVDAAFKDKETSDRVSMQVWGRVGADCFLLDRRHGLMSFVVTAATLVALRNRWAPWGLSAVWVEDKANGTAVIDLLQHDIPALVPIEPHGGKLARAHAASPMIQAGNVYLPTAAAQPWVKEYEHELTRFPKSAHDDDVDATTQALNLLRPASGVASHSAGTEGQSQWSGGAM